MLKISIITVSYNSERTISDTINSVLNQTYNNIEYIIVDGSSKDSTIDIIKQYEPLFNGRMKWISEKDKGLYDAMNKGIRMATGDVIGIINSDDFFTKNNIIEIVAKSFEQNDVDAIYGDIHFVDPLDLTRIVRYYSSKNFTISRFKYGFMPAHPSCYIKKNCFENIGYYSLNYKIAADFELLVRFMHRNHIKTIYIPLDMVTMRTGGISTNSFKSTILLNREILKACKSNHLRTNGFNLILKYFIKIFQLRLFH